MVFWMWLLLLKLWLLIFVWEGTWFLWHKTVGGFFCWCRPGMTFRIEIPQIGSPSHLFSRSQLFCLRHFGGCHRILIGSALTVGETAWAYFSPFAVAGSRVLRKKSGFSRPSSLCILQKDDQSCQQAGL